jgi:hypothetical protein
MNDDSHPWWWPLLPIEQFIVFGAMPLLMPAVAGMYWLSRGRVLWGALAFVGWLPFFTWKTSWLERRGIVRGWVTWPGALAVLVTVAYAFFSGR